MPKFTDTITALNEPRITQDGYLVASVLCARTGIQLYSGAEVGKPELKIVRVLRPESEVFAKDSLSSYAGKPATNNHPDDDVTADNWKIHAVGSIGNEIARDGEYVRVPLILMDSVAIKDVQADKGGLSMGYDADLTFTAGVTDSGEAYDAVVSNIRINHIAIVDSARAGSRARIGDGATNWGASPIIKTEPPVMTTRKLIVDGISIETTEQGAEAITKLQDGLTKAKDEAVAAIALKDKELATKDAEIATLKAAILTDAQIDEKVQARASLVDKARKLTDADFTGKTDAEIMALAVKAKRGEAAIKDKSPAYIEAAFDIAVTDGATAGTDQFRQSMQHRDNTAPADNGQSAYEKRLNDAWKGAK